MREVRRSGEEGEEGDAGVRQAGGREGGREGRQAGRLARDDKVRVTACGGCCCCFPLSSLKLRSYLLHRYSLSPPLLGLLFFTFPWAPPAGPPARRPRRPSLPPSLRSIPPSRRSLRSLARPNLVVLLPPAAWPSIGVTPPFSLSTCLLCSLI